MAIELNIPDACAFLLEDKARFKVLHGGRGGAKSQSMAACLAIKAVTGREHILCTREYQTSIKDSVHALLSAVINDMGLAPWFVIQEKTIRCLSTGSTFIFKGLHHSINEIKSMHGVTICWVEEAQAVSYKSWRTLEPTIREPGSEIWVSFNPYQENDATSQLFLEHPDERMIVKRINWNDNPWFPPDLEKSREIMLRQDPVAYEHVWNGEYLTISDATIFRGNYEVCTFETPVDARFFYGLDFGFADDPAFAIRCFIQDKCLYIDYEACGYHVEIDDLPEFLDGGRSKKNGMVWPGIPGIRQWPLKADASAPAQISYLSRRGFNIRAAEKWPGSVEDGIAHLKGFTKIFIHERCPALAREARLYSYKVDKNVVTPERPNGEILPIIVDKHNHGWDSCVAAGQLIETARGPVPIERVIVGDEVMTRKGFKRVYATRESGVKPIWTLVTGCHALYATPDHLIFNTNGEAVELEAFKYGGWLVASNGNGTMSGYSATAEPTFRQMMTYDLSVEDAPEFIASGILVHNCRYSLDGYILSRGADSQWRRIAQRATGKVLEPL